MLSGPCGALAVLFFAAARLVTPVVLRFGFLNACSELQVLHKTRTGWPALTAMMTCARSSLQRTAVGIDIVTSAVHRAFYSFGGELAASTRSEEIAQDQKPCSMGLFPDFEMGKVRYGCLYRVDRPRIA